MLNMKRGGVPPSRDFPSGIAVVTAGSLEVAGSTITESWVLFSFFVCCFCLLVVVVVVSLFVSVSCLLLSPSTQSVSISSALSPPTAASLAPPTGMESCEFDCATLATPSLEWELDSVDMLVSESDCFTGLVPESASVFMPLSLSLSLVAAASETHSLLSLWHDKLSLSLPRPLPSVSGASAVVAVDDDDDDAISAEDDVTVDEAGDADLFSFWAESDDLWVESGSGCLATEAGVSEDDSEEGVWPLGRGVRDGGS